MTPDPCRDSRPEPTGELITELTMRLHLDRAPWRDLGGSQRANLLVRDRGGAARVVRIHPRSTTPDRLAAEQEVRALLAAAGVPTVVALARIRTESGHLVELEPYVRPDGRMNTPDRLITGFAQLARLHDVLRGAELPGASRTVAHANHISLDAAAPATRHGAERIRGWGAPGLDGYAAAVLDLVEAVSEAESAWTADRVEQVVHGDFWDNNVLFRGSRIAAVLDFGFMAQRLRVDDLALPFWFYLLEPGHGLPGEVERRLLRRLLDSYDAGTDRPLSAAERLSLPLVVARQPAWSVGRWIVELDDLGARRHAEEAAGELAAAEAVWHDRWLWQEALS